MIPTFLFNISTTQGIPLNWHALFDVLAWVASGLTAWWVRRRWLSAAPTARTLPYLVSLIVGVCAGAYGLGTLNLWVAHALQSDPATAGMPTLGRSVLGALLGGGLSVEIFKRAAGYRESTGAVWALPFAVGVAVGRVGCQLAGLQDATFGTPTTVPWGIALEDGVVRHPVPLYEAAAMGLFAVMLALGLQSRRTWATKRGFALLALFYGLQRFGWECLKPLPAAVGPLSVMQVACLLLVAYGIWLWRSAGSGDGVERRGRMTTF